MVRQNSSSDGLFQSVTTRVAGGFKSAVLAISWSCDGKHLFAAGDTSTVRVFEAERLAQRDQTAAQDSKTFSGPKAQIEHVVSSPRDRHVFATTGRDSALHIFDARKAPKATRVIPLGDQRGVSMAWSDDGKWIVVGDYADAIHIVSTEKGAVQRTTQRDVEVNQMRWSKEGELMYLARGDGRVEVLTWPKMRHALFLNGHRDRCLGIAVDPTGRRLTVSSADTLLTVWDAKAMRCEYVVDRVEKACACIDYSFNGKYLAMAVSSGGIEIMHADSGARVIVLPTPGPVRDMKWHPSRLLLAYCVLPDANGTRERQPTRMYPGAPMITVPPQAKAFVYGFPLLNSSQRKR